MRYILAREATASILFGTPGPCGKKTFIFTFAIIFAQAIRYAVVGRLCAVPQHGANIGRLCAQCSRIALQYGAALPKGLRLATAATIRWQISTSIKVGLSIFRYFSPFCATIVHLYIFINFVTLETKVKITMYNNSHRRHSMASINL